MPITTDVESSNLDQGEVRNHYVIKFVSDLRQVCGPPVSSTNKTDCHNITEIYQTQSNKQTNIYRYYNVKVSYFELFPGSASAISTSITSASIFLSFTALAKAKAQIFNEELTSTNNITQIRNKDLTNTQKKHKY